MFISLIISLAIVIGITTALQKVRLLQNADEKAKSLISTGCWVGFGAAALDFLVWLVLRNVFDSYLLSSITFASNGVVLLGIVMLGISVLREKLDKKFSSIELAEGETVLLEADSLISDKVNGIAQKVFKFGGIALVVLFGYDALSSIAYRIERKGFSMRFDDFLDMLSNIPYALAYALIAVSVLAVLVTLCCVFVKNKLVITNKRVYGRGNFCKFVNVEYGQITAVAANGNNGAVISIGLTDIGFWSIDKRDEAVALIAPNVNLDVNPDVNLNVKPQEEIVVEKREEDEVVSSPVVTINPLLKQAYRKVWKVIVFSLITFGIYFFVWIYKMTKALNLVDENDQRKPGKTVLLCILFPLYTIWWFYKSAAAVKKLELAVGVKSDIGVLCPIFGMIMPFIAIAILQDSLNRVVE